ncbi:MAG: PorT family protein [Bacteroidales bacterium]|nr:PorT family protein [Bacteroidales bacterium]
MRPRQYHTHIVRTIALGLTIVFAAIFPTATEAQRRLNDRVLNRPYADGRPWHLGFSVGLNTMDLRFVHNGFVTADGETWFMDQPDFSPGFCVNGLIDFRLNNYLNLRFSPGMYFGSRKVKMVDTTLGGETSQNVKSTFVVLPLDLKYSALRFRNLRPYLVGGVMPAFDVAKGGRDFLKLQKSDVYLTVGFGCDFYLPFFKLCPELKFCFGLRDVICHDRPDLEDDAQTLKITQSLTKAVSQMVVLTFYFE